MGHSDGSSGVSRRNLGKRHHNVFAGLDILQLGAPVRHAHGLEPTEYVGTTFIGDEISNLHLPQVRTSATTDIGTQVTLRYPLVGAFFEAPLRDIADADDADGALACDDGNVTETTFDHRLARVLDRGVRGHRDRVGRHPFPYARLAGVHPPG